jgi:hypothetical protein
MITHIIIFMKALIDFALKEAYKRVERLGDKLAEIESVINWEAFRPIVGNMYNNRSERGGRPNIDEVVMIKLLVLSSGTDYPIPNSRSRRQTGSRLGSFLDFQRLSLILRPSGISESDWRRPVKTERSGWNSNDNLMLLV